MIKRGKKLLLSGIWLALLLLWTLPLSAAASSGGASVSTSAGTALLKAASASGQTVKNGLLEENGKRYYYQNGVKVKKQWKTIGGYRYYFGKSGAACTENTKVNGKVYLFRMDGRLFQPEKPCVIILNGYKYFVNKNGQTVSGSVKIGEKRYIFRENGRMVHPAKKTFVTVGGNRYYVTPDGWAYTGTVTLWGKIYVFRYNGILVQPKSTSLVTISGNRYYLNPKGQAQTGWLVINGGLYYGDQSGMLWRNRTYEGIEFGSDGRAADNTSARLKMKLMEIMPSITDDSMTTSQKLRACWNYLVGGRFSYWSKYPNLNKTGWQKETALDMLNTRAGNCYSFACAFAAFAAELGYTPYVVCARVSGTRDGAADGLTRHSWVKIDGKNYDPEGQYAGWGRGIYGTSGFPVYHVIQRVVDFRNSV